MNPTRNPSPPVFPGQIYGKLTAREISTENISGPLKWICDCSCGNTKTVSPSALRSGGTQSCGCLRLGYNPKETPGKAKAYAAWAALKAKCNNPKNKSFPTCGGKGIKYDPRWEDFEVFHKEMGDGPEGNYFVRLDADKDFSKTNCAWKMGIGPRSKILESRLIYPLRIDADKCVVDKAGKHILTLESTEEEVFAEKFIKELNNRQTENIEQGYITDNRDVYFKGKLYLLHDIALLCAMDLAHVQRLMLHPKVLFQLMEVADGKE